MENAQAAREDNADVFVYVGRLNLINIIVRIK